MRHRTTIVGLLATLLLTGCTSGSDNDSDSKPSPVGSSLAAKWGPKLKSAAAGETAVCNQVGDQACAEHLTDIALAVTDVETAITAAGSSGYPESTAEIEKINAAVDAYTEHECLGDENAGIPGSPCPDDVQTILSGVVALPLALQADEAR